MGNSPIIPIKEPDYLQDIKEVKFLYEVETCPSVDIYKIFYNNNKTSERSLSKNDLQILQLKGINVSKPIK